ncbi:hypothetical protein CEXT_331551 [Caerostris extrusa]|uniref:Uncharacterized protein n=1 Tax=Caerostris extrusa TaxID=172846 RepID=A0AAV4NMS6_CAEEX|nr:hypothetical protein CEXT_331551 [Caerostris extrusa]
MEVIGSSEKNKNRADIPKRKQWNARDVMTPLCKLAAGRRHHLPQKSNTKGTQGVQKIIQHFEHEKSLWYFSDKQSKKLNYFSRDGGKKWKWQFMLFRQRLRNITTMKKVKAVYYPGGQCQPQESISGDKGLVEKIGQPWLLGIITNNAKAATNVSTEEYAK